MDKRMGLIARYLIALVALFFWASTATAAMRDEVVLYLNDNLGSAVAAFDEQGNHCWTETYTPYGDKTVMDDSFIPSGCGAIMEERGYTGHTEDYETNLVYMQQRYYDPSIGRFLSMDSVGPKVGNPKSFNRYSYGQNNPYRFVDPDGRQAIDGTQFGFRRGYTRSSPFDSIEMYDIQPQVGVNQLIGAAVLAGFLGLLNSSNEDDAGAAEQGATEAEAEPNGAESERSKSLAKGIPASVLGPSGKPKIHVKKHPNRKRAKDRAQARSRRGGTANEHRNPTKGEDPHFHPDGSNSREHHTYPDGGYPRKKEY